MIRTLDGTFDVLGTSPHFLQDWRWYKSIPSNSRSSAEVAIDCFRTWSPYLLDYRLEPGPVPSLDRSALSRACQSALDSHNLALVSGTGNQHAEDFFDQLAEIGAMIAADLPTTAISISDYLTGMASLQGGNLAADFASFRTWFGRGQQYISFARKV